jgi:multidrug efflux pump subunit AcrA (membrane-fusion protein)
MTANLDIKTNERKNVLTVPTRAILTEDSSRLVRIVNPDNKTYKNVPIKVGLKGSDGMSEIISGLNIGDRVVTYIR